MANNAKNLQFQYNYTGEGYLDAKTSVETIEELISKWDFEGQSVSMPKAFFGQNNIPYPIDFWLVPYGEIDRWEIKTMPTIESTEDFERFKVFCDDFKMASEYYPLTTGQKINVAGEEFEFFIDKEGKATWVSIQDNFDETISKGTVLVDFWASWCNPCKIFGKILEEVAKEISDDVIIGKVEIEENPQLAVRFSVTNIPYIVLFHDGQAVTELYGIQNKAKLLQLLSGK